MTLRTFSRWQASLAKRFFWRSHLAEAQATLQRLRNELPTVELMLAIPYLFQGKGYYQTLGLKQNMVELLSLVNAVRQQRLRTVCEIGTFKGGTLFIWCQLAAADAHLISIDLPGGQFGGGYNVKCLPFFDSFRKPGQTLDCLRGSSQDESIRTAFRKKLAGRQLDFLFIDGDHSYDGVSKDFEHYVPFVRTGGLIALHDIIRREPEPEIEVWRFWDEIKGSFRHEEFIDRSPERRTIGLGLLYKE